VLARAGSGAHEGEHERRAGVDEVERQEAGGDTGTGRLVEDEDPTDDRNASARSLSPAGSIRPLATATTKRLSGRHPGAPARRRAAAGSSDPDNARDRAAAAGPGPGPGAKVPEPC
jgi:hypothetical protein